jgi:hypothetical protein
VSLTSIVVKPGPGPVKQTSKRVKLIAGQKFNSGPGQQLNKEPGLSSKLNRARAEDWKILKSFIGLKLNDAEKVKLWPAVRHLYLKKGKISKERANIGTWIKEAMMEKVSHK